MSWVTHVKKQNLGLADTCLPPYKKRYQLDVRYPFPTTTTKKGIPDTPEKKLPDDIVGNLFYLFTIG